MIFIGTFACAAILKMISGNTKPTALKAKMRDSDAQLPARNCAAQFPPGLEVPPSAIKRRGDAAVRFRPQHTDAATERAPLKMFVEVCESKLRSRGALARPLEIYEEMKSAGYDKRLQEFE